MGVDTEYASAQQDARGHSLRVIAFLLFTFLAVFALASAVPALGHTATQGPRRENIPVAKTTLGASNQGRTAMIVVPPDFVYISSITGHPLINTPITFTAEVRPISVTMPVTYPWEADGQQIVTHVGGVTDAVCFTWTEEGSKQIDLTAANAGGTAEHSESLTVYRIDVRNLATSPALPQVIMATLNNYSATPIYSLDGGKCWKRFETTPFSYVSRIAIAIARRSDGTPRFLVAVDDEKGLFRTGDYGRTWANQPFPHPTIPGNGDCYVGLPLLVSSPVDHNRLYLSVNFYCGQQCDMFDVCHWDVSATYASLDAGVTWGVVLTGTTEERTGTTDEIVPSPVLDKRVYLHGVYLAQYGWQRSDDGGRSWLRAL